MIHRNTEEVVTTATPGRWSEILERIGRHDFCHLPAFSRLAERCEQGEARLLVFAEAETVVAFPLLLRDVAGVVPGFPGAWRDATSVYGYAGPLASAPLSEEVQSRFCAFVDAFCREHRVVSAFSRLHPLFDQPPVLAAYGAVVPVGWTLSLDLTQSEECQWSGFRRNHRHDIRKLVAQGVTCEPGGPGDLDAFIDMYYETMDRVGASPLYYFSKGYFLRLLEDMPEVVHLFICRHEGTPVAGGIFTLCQDIVQWYFSGTRASYHGPPPAKLLFDVARKWAADRGARTLHLGGGVGSKRDSLYHFKCGFTHREHVYSTWQHVVHPEVYEELYRAQHARTGLEPDGDFFPRYRHPDFAPDRSLRCHRLEGGPTEAASLADQVVPAGGTRP